MHQTVYIFRRAEGWYPVEGTIRDDDDARENAHCNPGTLEVIRMWPLPEESVWKAGQEQ